MTTLQDVLPSEFRGYSDTEAYKYKDVKVVEQIDGTVTPWPGHEKNVFWWFLLENGKRVGWNENPSRGWTFPVLGKARKPKAPKKTRLVYRLNFTGHRYNGPYHRPEGYLNDDVLDAIYNTRNDLIEHATPYSQQSKASWDHGEDSKIYKSISAANAKFLNEYGHEGNKGYFGWSKPGLMIGYFRNMETWHFAFKAFEVTILEVSEDESFIYPDGQIVFDMSKAVVIKTIQTVEELEAM